jgi:pimeloyl-ACP methyl ester carboxylesterase
MSTFVIVHGAWHDGSLFAETAAPIRAAGHVVHTPTLAGNRPGDRKDGGLEEAIASLIEYVAGQDLRDIVLCGHSYGGMVITGTADRIGERIRRLVYWNAFVPYDGESLESMTSPEYVAIFDAATEADGSFMLPFEIWREMFINDGTFEQARASYARLNPHPRRCFSDPIRLDGSPADFTIGKSYVNCTEDIALPHSRGWHPRLSEKLGLFRLVQIPGSHELCFTDPPRLARALMDAGRD